MVLPALFQWVNSFSFPFKHLVINPHCVVLCCCRRRRQRFCFKYFVISAFLQNVWYVKLSRVPFPLYIAMMASSPALMISCFVTALGNLFNTSIVVAKLSQAVFFNAIHVPSPNPKILDVVSHPKIVLVLVYFYMSMPNFA